MLHKLPLNPRGIRVLKTVESTRLKENNPDISKLPPSPKNCITCKGTVRFRWWNQEFTEIVEYECNCEQQWLLHRYLLYNGIGLNFQRIGWKQCNVDEESHRMVRTYLDGNHLDYNLEVGTGMFLFGEKGTGKTLLSTLLLRRTLAYGHTGHFTSFLEMKDAYTGAWKDEDKSDWYQRKVRQASVLVIDDPGKEMGGDKPTELARSILDDMIRHRMSSGLPTIITSNFTPEEFRLRYGGFVDSLMSERMIPVNVVGEDWRKTMFSNSEEERIAGLTRPIVVG